MRGEIDEMMWLGVPKAGRLIIDISTPWRLWVYFYCQAIIVHMWSFNDDQLLCRILCRRSLRLDFVRQCWNSCYIPVTLAGDQGVFFSGQLTSEIWCSAYSGLYSGTALPSLAELCREKSNQLPSWPSWFSRPIYNNPSLKAIPVAIRMIHIWLV